MFIWGNSDNKGCFSYIMKSEAHCLSLVSCFTGVLKAFSPPLSPCKPWYRGLRTVRLSQRQIGSERLGGGPLGPVFLALPLASYDPGRPSSPPEALVPHLYKQSTASGDGCEDAVRESAANTSLITWLRVLRKRLLPRLTGGGGDASVARQGTQLWLFCLK